MDPESPSEKETKVSERRASDMSIEVTARRASDMSVEEPPSPGSSSSSSIGEEEYESDYRANSLRPTISRTSSTNAVGGVVPTFGLARTKSSATLTDPVFEIDFQEDEKGNPRNWPLWYVRPIGTRSFGTAGTHESHSFSFHVF